MSYDAVMTSEPIYRGMSRDEIDRAYDNRGAVPNSRACLARWAEASLELYRTVPAHRDLHYGADPRQRMDFFPARHSGRPTVFYIHGGYWQWCDKEDEAFIAAGPLAHDINVAIVEYTLCPQISLRGMVAEISAALRWLLPLLPELGADPTALVVAGSSAGAHLAAMMAGRPEVKGTLLISGIYELEPIRLSRMNETLRLDVMSSMHNSPILNLPEHAGPACFAVGSGELGLPAEFNGAHQVARSGLENRDILAAPVKGKHPFRGGIIDDAIGVGAGLHPPQHLQRLQVEDRRCIGLAVTNKAAV